MLVKAMVWMLIYIYGHGSTLVPGIVDKAECERIFVELKQLDWARGGAFGQVDHVCRPYTIVVGGSNVN